MHVPRMLALLIAVAPSAVAAELTPASHEAIIRQPTAIAGEVVTFSQQFARVGDRVAQSVVAELQLSTEITQAGQAAHKSQNTLNRRQQRFIEVLEVTEGQARRAQVTYPVSRLTSPENENPEAELVQAVEKRSYLVTRSGEKLQVTDLEGAIPSQAEFEIVLASMQNFGLPNPLAKFLLGQSIRIGERIRLPREIAQQLLGLGNEFGEVTEFELVLKSVREIDGQPCAVFAATIEAVGEPANPIRVRAFGKVVIQTETCRTVRAELSGPLTLSKVEHTAAASFEYAARGSMHAVVETRYAYAGQ